MSLERSVAVVDRAGSTIWQVDETLGPRDRTARIYTAPIWFTDRITATPLAAYMWTCTEGVWQVAAANAKASVTGGAGCAIDVLVSPGVTAPAGTTQLTGTIALTATAPFSINGVLIAAPTLIFPGDSVSRVISGTVGSIEGVLTVMMKRVQL